MTDNTTTLGHVEDEIDLRELVSIVIDGWYWIVGSVAVATLLGLSFVLLGERTYETTFRAVPAESGHFQALNELPGIRLDTNSVYRDLGNRLNSFLHFSSMVEQHPGLFVVPEDEELLNYFETKLSIRQPSGDGSVLTVSYRYADGIDGPAIINRYIALTAENLWNDYVNRFLVQTDSAIARYTNRIDIQREGIRNLREERLSELQQAIAIARDLGMEMPTAPQGYGRLSANLELLYANNEGILPLYFLGYRALEAELRVLEANLDAGLSNEDIRLDEQELRERQRLRALIGSNALDEFTGLGALPHVERLVNVLDYALQPSRPAGTSRALVMVLAVLLGGMFGFIMTFVAKFAQSVWQYRKQKGTFKKA